MNDIRWWSLKHNFCCTFLIVNTPLVSIFFYVLSVSDNFFDSNDITKKNSMHDNPYTFCKLNWVTLLNIHYCVLFEYTLLKWRFKIVLNKIGLCFDQLAKLANYFCKYIFCCNLILVSCVQTRYNLFMKKKIWIGSRVNW